MERVVLKLGMFETLGISVLAIYFGDFLRSKFPILKKYCLPGAVVGGTIFAIISLILYQSKIFELKFDYAAVNSLFYCIFFTTCGAAASMALLRKGGLLVVIFAILAAGCAILQNVLALAVGKVLNVPPLIALMTGSIPMTGGHGNAASFAPMAVKLGAEPALTVALAAATWGLISGSIIGGPFGNFIVKAHHLENPELDGKDDVAALAATAGVSVKKKSVVSAMLLMCLGLGFGQLVFIVLKKFKIDFPIHVCCMFAGIVIRLIMDATKKGNEVIYESMETVGEFSLALFVSMSIVSMSLWQLSGLGLQLFILCLIQVPMMLLIAYFLTFFLMGRNYDAAIIAVGHTGFGLGAVPVSMTTMQSVCTKYRYSKLAYFVVPVIGGFLSNITNAIIITNFIGVAAKMQGL
jgi:ESS family glutamate:Na+ symporter